MFKSGEIRHGLASATTIPSSWGDLFFPSIRRVSAKHILPRCGPASQRSGPGIAPASPACVPRMDGTEPTRARSPDDLESERKKEQKNTPFCLQIWRKKKCSPPVRGSCQRIPPMRHNDGERKHRFQRSKVMQARGATGIPPHHASGKRKPSAPCTMATGRACVCISAALSGRRVLAASLVGVECDAGYKMVRESAVDGKWLFCFMVLSSLLWVVRTMPSLSFVQVRVQVFSRKEAPFPPLSCTLRDHTPTGTISTGTILTTGAQGPSLCHYPRYHPRSSTPALSCNLHSHPTPTARPLSKTRLRAEAISPKANKKENKNNPNGRQPILSRHSPRRTSPRNRYPRHQVLHPPPLGTEHGDSPPVPHRRSCGAAGHVSGSSSFLPSFSKGRDGSCRTKGAEAEASSLGRVFGRLKCMFDNDSDPNHREADDKLSFYKPVFSPTALSLRFSTLTQKS